MSDKLYKEKGKIKEILSSSNRLKFLITETYGVAIDDIDNLRVDSDNFKVDVNTLNTMYRFKAKGVQNVLLKDNSTGNMKMALDPVLAQAIHEICNDFS